LTQNAWRFFPTNQFKPKKAFSAFKETQFALGVVIDSQFVKPQRLRDLYQESGEIVAIMTTIGKRASREKTGKVQKSSKND
jgi:hypothetical protein